MASRYGSRSGSKAPRSSNGPEFKLHRTLFEWDKDDRGNRYRVNIARLGDRKFLDIRLWYTDADTDELKPGKGLALPMEDDHIDRLLEAMDIVHEEWEGGELLK